jgi:Type II secretion system (T2SS), protein M subtype b
MRRPDLWRAHPRLQLEVALWHAGWVWLVIAGMAATTVAGWVWWWPQQQRDLAALHLTVNQTRIDQASRRAVPALAPSLSGDDAVLAELKHIGYAETELSRVLRTISALAKAEGIVLGQSAFQTSIEPHGGLRQVQITLPMAATYPQLRRFAEAVLRQLPGVSVDQFGLKREAIAQGQADTRLKLSVWLDPHKIAASPALPASASKVIKAPVVRQALVIPPRREGSL